MAKMSTAPKDGTRVLIHTHILVFDFKTYRYIKKGTKWVEAYFGKDSSGKMNWLVWTGSYRSWTTETLTPIEWCPLPVSSNKEIFYGDT